MSYAVVRMEKMKVHDLKGIQFHNQRERESRTNPDIDKERTKDNFDAVNVEPIDYNQRVREIIESQKTGTRKIRKDAVVVNEFIITSDTDFFKNLNEHDTRKFFEESVKFFQERYGAQNVAYGVVHLDETTPHMHLGVVPMRDGRLQGKNVFNRQELLDLQEEFPKFIKEKGFDLERGERGSTRGHLTTAQFKLEKAIEKKQEVEQDANKTFEKWADTETELTHLKKEKQLLEKKVVELKEKSTTIPDKLKIKAEKEKKKTSMFGKEQETGNLIITQKAYDNLNKKLSAAHQITDHYQELLATDFVKENASLSERVKALEKENTTLRTQNKTLVETVRSLEVQLKNMKLAFQMEVRSAYRGIKEFLKENTSAESFDSLFKQAIEKVSALCRKERSTCFKDEKGYIEDFYRQEQQQKQRSKSRSRDMER